jgi:uncharacterized RDD family membrane protein YckC
MSVERVQLWRVRTPEGVAFTFRLASPLLRLAAVVIDWATVAAAYSIIAVPVALLKIVSADFSAMIATVSYFILSQGYRMASEWLWRGQTVGKRLLQLRVVDERGLRLTFAQVALRNLLRFVDVLPVAYLVGGVAAVLSRRGQRLGDLAAGTLVIWEPTDAAPDLELLSREKYNSLRDYPAVTARLRHAITPAEGRVAWQALARREEMEAASRVTLFAELAAHFRRSTAVPDEVLAGVSDEQFVRNIVDVLYVNRG